MSSEESSPATSFQDKYSRTYPRSLPISQNEYSKIYPRALPISQNEYSEIYPTALPLSDHLIHTSESMHKEKLVRLMSLESTVESVSSVASSKDSEEVEEKCIFFCDIPTFAENFVDEIIAEADGLINKHCPEIPIKRIPSDKTFFGKSTSDDFFPVIKQDRPKFTGWPCIGDFSIAVGADKIDEYLSSFSTDEEWLYIIYYLGLKEDHTSKFYKYQAIWSLPSPEYPIPQATASIFFNIEVSEVIPDHCLVNVTFNFEGHQFKHKPGLTDFNEEFLNYILDSKIGIFKNVKF